MQICLLSGIVIECIILLLAALIKKLTRRTFIMITAVTMGCSIVLAGLQSHNMKENDVADHREGLYMAARLLEDDYKEAALEALATVIDAECTDYHVQTLRGLVFNQNEYYDTAVLYLEKAEDEMAQKVYYASLENTLADETDKAQIIEDTISLLEVSSEEAEVWEAKMKLLYIDPNFEKVQEGSATDVLMYTKAAIKDNQYEKAYLAMKEAARNGGVREDIIVSDMYVKNYNLRTMEEDDPEYDELWRNLTQLQTQLNTLSVQVQDERENSLNVQRAEDKEETELEKEYKLVYANYRLAQQDMTNESVGRAINYLEYSKPENYQTNIGYQLQMCKLYFLSGQEDMAESCLDNIFAVEEIDQNQWLGTDAYLLREAFLLYLSDTNKGEYKEIFQQMMNHLYQGVFDEEIDSDFCDFVTEYLRSLLSGIVIIDIEEGNYPEMTVNVSCIDEELSIDQDTITVTDTDQMIDQFQITETEVNDLSLCFVLDKSGSMSGDSIRDAKRAIQECIMSLDDFVKVSLVSFENDAYIECGLTGSKYLLLNKLDGIDANGGTDIVAGLTMAYDTLATASGKKVIVLLSDGYADDSGLTDILSQLKSAGIEVYAIGLEGCDEAYLQRVADETDGKYISVNNTGELGSIYREIQKSLIHVYTITYTNTETEKDPRYFKLRYKDSLKQAKRVYMQAGEETEQSIQVYYEEEQASDYFKQTGGSKGGAGR